MDSELRAQRIWFEAFCARLEEDEAVHQQFPYRLRSTCPCCGYPTLHDRGCFEMCILCTWEDDGQDDAEADKVWGGPNFRYSLTTARENFKQYWVMYDPNDSHFPNIDSDLMLDAKESVCESFDQLIIAEEETRKHLLQIIKKGFDTLDSERRRISDEYQAQFKE